MPSPRKSTKSTGKSRSGSRGRSRSRSRSRSRGRARSRSTSRSRAKKAVVTSPSPGKVRSSRKTDVVDTPELKVEETVVVNEVKQRTTRSSKTEMAEETPTRKSARIAALTNSKWDESLSGSYSLNDGSDKEKAKGKEYEFGGPFGAFLLLFFMPATVYGLNLICSKNQCSIRQLPKFRYSWRMFFDKEAALIFFCWLAFQSIIYALPIGRLVSGQPIKGGRRLKYRCNGFIALILSIATFGVAVFMRMPVTRVYDKFLPLITTATLFSLALSVFLYIRSYQLPKFYLSNRGNSGNPVYDFFMGRELNPRIGSFDLKFFFELRPGLIGWIMLDLCFIAKSCQQNHYPSPALCLVSFFHLIYVADALWFEDAILTTMDILHDGFGFMLAFGDLVWVPFLYSLQTRFLLEHPQEWRWYGLAGIAVLKLVGYIVFRGSNSQKNEFRKNPHSPALAHLETIPTPTGRRLLVSGWWGLCRHPNYLGDLIMALAWSLPTGFSHVLPYFYPIYFFILLVHRSSRDGHSCKKKYGTSWDKYCERVKYQIIPHVY